MPLFGGLPWSAGEQVMQQRLAVPELNNPTAPYLTPQAAFAVSNYPLLAIGISDAAGRIWTTLWGGAPGLARAIGQNLLGINTAASSTDPVVQTLSADGFQGRMISALSIDLVQRKRVKLSGGIVAGAYQDSDIQLILQVEQSLGNCPKYLNQKFVQPSTPTVTVPFEGTELTTEAINLIERSDLFFMTSRNGDVDMDTNHRGGSPGFVRVESSTKIAYPEYSGNRFYQSLGNLIVDPTIGICFPDFETGDVLYATGSAEILIGEDAQRHVARSNLVVLVDITQTKLVPGGLPMRGSRGDMSPYNPKIRTAKAVQVDTQERQARMIWKHDLTDTITKYRFQLEEDLKYKPGQWVALDLSDELDVGYSHMREHDPQSLNDDFIRTFTISSHPDDLPTNEFELTVRTKGPVTSFLRRQHIRSVPKITVLGVGGSFIIEKTKSPVGFIAAGVGITPLLGQLRDVNVQQLRLIWITRGDDAQLVLDVLETHSELVPQTLLFLTSTNESVKSQLEALLGAKRIQYRRPSKADFDNETAERWYVCTAPALQASLTNWLQGRDVKFEDFIY